MSEHFTSFCLQIHGRITCLIRVCIRKYSNCPFSKRKAAQKLYESILKMENCTVLRNNNELRKKQKKKLNVLNFSLYSCDPEKMLVCVFQQLPKSLWICMLFRLNNENIELFLHLWLSLHVLIAVSGRHSVGNSYLRAILLLCVIQ